MASTQGIERLTQCTWLPDAAAAQEDVPFVAATWERWTSDTPFERATSNVLERFDAGVISRKALRDLASKQDPADPSANSELFVATMIWGRGKNNGRMKEAFRRTFLDPLLIEVLEETRAASINGSPGGAYKSWTLSKGIREAFFTKWLWAAGSGSTHAGLNSLILDARVWKSLGSLGWNSKEAAGSTRRYLRYESYCAASAEWAELVGGTSPEDIEFALFRCAGDLQLLDTPIQDQ